jgi:hypothetical protein
MVFTQDPLDSKQEFINLQTLPKMVLSLQDEWGNKAVIDSREVYKLEVTGTCISYLFLSFFPSFFHLAPSLALCVLPVIFFKKNMMHQSSRIYTDTQWRF